MKHYKLTDGVLLAEIQRYDNGYVIIEYSMESGKKEQEQVLIENFRDLDSFIKSKFTVIEIL